MLFRGRCPEELLYWWGSTRLLLVCDRSSCLSALGASEGIDLFTRSASATCCRSARYRAMGQRPSAPR